MPSVNATHANMTTLAQKLAARIAAEGPITLHDYMEACLYDPVHGYYKKKDPLGRGGDFITAPEISQVFGELAGLWAGETWRLMGQPNAVRLIELGPGRGTLMADALRALRVLPAFLNVVTVHLIETSAALRVAQQAALAGAPYPIRWHGRIEEVPAGAAIVIANEFFDCLPIRQFVFDETARLWRERTVAFRDGHFAFALSPDGAEMEFPSVEDGAIMETRPGAAGMLRSFAARAADAPLAALIVDYGYSQPASGDTLQAVLRHRFASVFEAPGEADLTAHVDFFDLNRRAKDLKFAVSGPMPMGEWLLRLGLEARVNRLLQHASPEAAADIRSRVSRLVDPARMGALFKAAVLTAGVSATPPPFG